MSKFKAKTIISLVFPLLLIVGGVSAYAPDKSVSELSPRWAATPSKFIEVDGMKVHFRDEGPRDDPHPLVLLHGTSASLHTWEGWVSALKDKHRVITLDMPGFGLTGPFLTDDYSMTHYVTFIDKVLDTLQAPRYTLAGNSFGGDIAWHMALAYPNKVEKLILVDAGGYAFKPESMPIGFKIAQIPVLNKVMEYTLPRNMVESSVRSVYVDQAKVTSDLVDRYYDLTLRAGNRHALVERFKQVSGGEGVEDIPKIAVPTLILWGKDDRLILPENGERFHKDIQGSQLVMLDGLGHVPHEEDPAKTVAAVKGFLGE